MTLMQVDPGDVLAFNIGVYMKDYVSYVNIINPVYVLRSFQAMFSVKNQNCLKDVIFCDTMTNPCRFYL